MSERTRQLLAEAMKLPPAERTELVEQISASLSLAERKTTPDSELNKQIARNFIDAINRGDFQAIADAYAEDGVCWTAGSMPISGTYTRAQVAETSKQILTAFPQGLTITVKRLTAEADRVAIEAESHGRHVSGKPYHNQYHILMRLRDGKIVEWREYMDTMHANEVLCGGGP